MNVTTTATATGEALFDKLFDFSAVAIPETINGQGDVAIKGADLQAGVEGEGATPHMRARFLLAAIAANAFGNGGVGFAALADAKGNKGKIRAAQKAAGALPACRGKGKKGEEAVPLTAQAVTDWLALFAKHLGTKKAAKPPTYKVPDLAKFIKKFGKQAAHDFAVTLLAATGGIVAASDATATASAEPAKAPRRRVKKAAADITASAAAAEAAAEAAAAEAAAAEAAAEPAKAPRRRVKKAA